MADWRSGKTAYDGAPRMYDSRAI